MRTRTIVFVALCAIVSTGIFADATEDDILGTWLTKDGKARVEITREGREYKGTIVWLQEPLYPEGDEEAGKEKHDRNNPDSALRTRPIIGLCIFSGFTYAGKKTWSGGSVYDPESGNTYKGKIWLDKNNQLMLRGYVGVSLLGRTEAWTRYTPGKQPEPNQEKAS